MDFYFAEYHFENILLKVLVFCFYYNIMCVVEYCFEFVSLPGNKSLNRKKTDNGRIGASYGVFWRLVFKLVKTIYHMTWSVDHKTYTKRD